MKKHEFTRYDHDKMERAKTLLLDVLNEHYEEPGMSGKIKRLETIIAKLETLQNLD